MNELEAVPIAEPEVGLEVLRALWRERTLLAAMRVMQQRVGPVFQITLPRFQPIVVADPEINRQLLVTDRASLCWRTEKDAVTGLLGHGLLVEDGEKHQQLRAQIEPSLSRAHTVENIGRMVADTDHLIERWEDGEERDMLVEMRRLALIILMNSLFRVDIKGDIDRLWHPILKAIKYIGPGLWIIWPDMPRWGYGRSLQIVDDYLYQLIDTRRAQIANGRFPADSPDLLTHLLTHTELTDREIRDQMLTMLIAGHDTSTALLSWVFYLLGKYPEEQKRVQEEVDQIFGQGVIGEEGINQLEQLDRVIKESLRLYPPIHIGNRYVPQDISLGGYRIPAQSRLMYSIYLTHRDERYWDEPEQFCPHRFARGEKKKRPSFAYLPFGGGPRNCIGAIFAQIEAKLILARIMQKWEWSLIAEQVVEHMGATLEPSPGVLVRLQRRNEA